MYLKGRHTETHLDDCKAGAGLDPKSWQAAVESCKQSRARTHTRHSDRGVATPNDVSIVTRKTFPQNLPPTIQQEVVLVNLPYLSIQFAFKMQ